jgi:hypothetical protein
VNTKNLGFKYKGLGSLVVIELLVVLALSVLMYIFGYNNAEIKYHKVIDCIVDGGTVYVDYSCRIEESK